LPETKLIFLLCPEQPRNPLLCKATRNDSGYLLVKKAYRRRLFLFQNDKTCGGEKMYL